MARTALFDVVVFARMKESSMFRSIFTDKCVLKKSGNYSIFRHVKSYKIC